MSFAERSGLPFDRWPERAISIAVVMYLRQLTLFCFPSFPPNFRPPALAPRRSCDPPRHIVPPGEASVGQDQPSPLLVAPDYIGLHLRLSMASAVKCSRVGPKHPVACHQQTIPPPCCSSAIPLFFPSNFIRSFPRRDLESLTPGFPTPPCNSPAHTNAVSTPHSCLASNQCCGMGTGKRWAYGFPPWRPTAHYTGTAAPASLSPLPTSLSLLPDAAAITVAIYCLPLAAQRCGAAVIYFIYTTPVRIQHAHSRRRMPWPAPLGPLTLPPSVTTSTCAP
ncbi:hypothetical protein GALMADRAFT_148520 [Galerina marginata CBS 339.88]|uniref:Uncharacterized protein n=1 Tax=Galerina marginata (strain CBS 339.88) TaxID=685588 RepID=A0A067SFW6_GALM3|nr:hypothetical protein GALMADRAFT_148520 [Galerina marginata CBS 339.88]